jgi:inner membrane protein involved in colicin E2 resistance
MSVARLVAIVIIFLGCTVAWVALGTSVTARSGEFDAALGQQVARLWGGPHVQVAPEAWVDVPREVVETQEERDPSGKTIHREVTRTIVEPFAVPVVATRAEVELDLEHRQKGLLWYPTYEVRFKAVYTIENTHPDQRAFGVRFRFPAATAIYDDFVLTLDGAAVPLTGDLTKEVIARAVVAPGARATLDVAYRSRGLETWQYGFGGQGVSRVQDFSLVLGTNFDRIDFPAGTMSPSAKSPSGDGWTLTWRFANLVTGQAIGVELPNRLNPGPLAARITFFAPVSLLFFLTVMVMLGVVTGRNLHPMNYFFVSAAFFAFHLLLAYLVDHLSIHVTFLLAALVSVGLVLSYLRLVAGARPSLVHAGAAQIVFLVLLSYAFFFEGFAGFTVTIGAVLTLFVLMQMTARVDWNAVFDQSNRGMVAPPEHRPVRP